MLVCRVLNVTFWRFRFLNFIATPSELQKIDFFRVFFFLFKIMLRIYIFQIELRDLNLVCRVLDVSFRRFRFLSFIAPLSPLHHRSEKLIFWVLFRLFEVILCIYLFLIVQEDLNLVCEDLNVSFSRFRFFSFIALLPPRRSEKLIFLVLFLLFEVILCIYLFLIEQEDLNLVCEDLDVPFGRFRFFSFIAPGSRIEKVD